MKNKKLYLVEAPSYDWDDIFLVYAENKKEAINKIFSSAFEWRNLEIKERGYSCPFYKKDFTAKKIDDVFKDSIYSNEVSCLH